MLISALKVALSHSVSAVLNVQTAICYVRPTAHLRNTPKVKLLSAKDVQLTDLKKKNNIGIAKIVISHYV